LIFFPLVLLVRSRLSSMTLEVFFAVYPLSIAAPNENRFVCVISGTKCTLCQVVWCHSLGKFIESVSFSILGSSPILEFSFTRSRPSCPSRDFSLLLTSLVFEDPGLSRFASGGS
jgi:hypothetical protein